MAASKAHDYKNLTQENYQVLSELYESNKNFEKALESFKNHIRYKDSIQSFEIQSKQAELDIEFETEKKEKEILLQKASLAEKNLWLLGVAALLVISVLLGYLFHNRQKMKNKQMVRENELKEALHRIETQNKLQEQRLAISRDLHDNIGAQLTFIISSLDNLKYGFSIEDERLKEQAFRYQYLYPKHHYRTSRYHLGDEQRRNFLFRFAHPNCQFYRECQICGAQHTV